MKKVSKRNVFRIIWFSIAGVLMFWNWTTFQSRNLPEGTFSDSEKVKVVEDDDQIVFTAISPVNSLEVIFFQGGLVDPKAYAPLGRKLAENGYTCHIIKMAWRLPQNDYQKISQLFDLNSGNYILGGHSQGGKMAAQFVYENPGLLKGLFLLGTSHPRDIDLANLSIPTLKLYAEKDGLASVGEVMENKNKLPKGSEMLLLAGGNHSQFGYIGTLFMDDAPEISLKDQQSQVFEYLFDFFTGIEDKD